MDSDRSGWWNYLKRGGFRAFGTCGIWEKWRNRPISTKTDGALYRRFMQDYAQADRHRRAEIRSLWVYMLDLDHFSASTTNTDMPWGLRSASLFQTVSAAVS